MSKKLTNEQFLECAQKMHGNKYDYSLVIYINTDTKIVIGCPTHGAFKQTPHSHLTGRGCKKCATDTNAINYNKGAALFISQALIIHDGKYDYSLVQYINTHVKVKIICPIHGLFTQAPVHHLHAHGCSELPLPLGRGFCSR